ncbi:putative endomembrane protein 70 [Trypanosoma theileri]|uniref:Transmembrane 9 superfamily member n=1 Tax=Trypanosoma theileri TaxID=67003 RepID=A0A1X0NLM6_9TRYP|nr:putative endomembrane protein 70 [Trypanosoma theileri]ORC85363.1 putative endomembrane protein 70 [Trypanosoma theileri]
MFGRLRLVILLTALFLGFPNVGCAYRNYNKGDTIPIYTGVVFPVNSGFERYEYYSLPFCKPKVLTTEGRTIWDVFHGSVKRTSDYKIYFEVNSTNSPLCQIVLDKSEKKLFIDAIGQDYVFTMFIDGIEVTYPVGSVSREGDVILNTGLLFKVFFITNQISKVIVESSSNRKLSLSNDPEEIEFFYNILWIPTSNSRSIPISVYDFFDFNELKIQWFSILNSLLLVALLCGFVIFILTRTLRHDFKRYGSLEEEMDQDDSGWKRLHADVFRFPKNMMLLCAIIGCGGQLILIAFVILTIMSMKIFYNSGETTINFMMILFLLTTPVSGFLSASFYRKFDGKHWSRNVLLTFFVLLVPILIVSLVINVIASIFLLPYAVSWGSFLLYWITFLVITFLLTLFGAIFGRRYGGNFDAPTRTKFVPREIPPLAWYRRNLIHILVGGLLPFTAVYIELYYVLLGLTGHQSRTPVVIVYMMFIVLIVVTASTNVALTYDRLNAENHKWWWPSALCGGSSAAYVFVYSIVFLFLHTHMRSIPHVLIYIGYTFLICHTLFLAMTTVGFFSSLLFVRQIFRYIKSD